MLTPSSWMDRASGLSMTQLISRQGTSYSLCRSPLASTERVVWKVLSPTVLPIRSVGDSMPASTLTHICDRLNSRRGNTGMALMGMSRLWEMRYDDSDNSQMSNSPSWSMRSWRRAPCLRGWDWPISSTSRSRPSAVTLPSNSGTCLS